MSRKSGRPLSSRIREIWRSVLSWMHWSQRRQVRRVQQEEILLARLQVTMQVLVRQQLWELGLPLADSLTRLDKRLLAHQLQQVQQQQELMELLLEILQGQMPPVSQQLGLSTPPQLPQSSGR